MRPLKIMLFTLFMLALTACGADNAALTTIQEELGEASGEAAAAIAAAQEDMADIGQRIQESEASEDLQAAWQDLQAELTQVFTSLQAEGNVDMAQVEQIMNDFEAQLEQAEDQLPPEVRETWDTLRAEIEQLVQQAG